MELQTQWSKATQGDAATTSTGILIEMTKRGGATAELTGGSAETRDRRDMDMTSGIDGNRGTTGTRAEEMNIEADRYHRHQLTQERAVRAPEATRNQQTGTGVTEYHAHYTSDMGTALTNDACDHTAPRTRMNA